jgi:hypothetical protein
VRARYVTGLPGLRKVGPRQSAEQGEAFRSLIAAGACAARWPHVPGSPRHRSYPPQGWAAGSRLRQVWH